MVQLLFGGPEAHEHAMWWLKLQSRYQRWPWWRLKPPAEIWALRVGDGRPGTAGIVGGWALTAWVFLRVLRNR
jgi:hypothetical protein